MTSLEAAFILFGFAAPSAVVGVQFSIGALGLLFGPLLCIFMSVMSAVGATMLHRLTLKYPNCQSLPSLGMKLLGRKGYYWGLAIQQGNFLLYLPVALLVCAQALQFAVDPDLSMLDGCIDYWILLVSPTPNPHSPALSSSCLSPSRPTRPTPRPPQGFIAPLHTTDNPVLFTNPPAPPPFIRSLRPLRSPHRSRGCAC